MKLIQSILTKNPCYTAGKKITVKGLMLHSVGTPQPSANVFIKIFNSSNYKNACVHGFIDANDGTVYQTLPWNHRGWHCGGKANNTHIGIEMCEPKSIKYTGGSTFVCTDRNSAIAAVKRTYESAVLLFAMLCKQYDLNPMADGVIISHKEGNKRGLASAHGDPEHLWNGLNIGYTMDGFRKDVKAAMNKESISEENNGVYQVKVEIPNLNIRQQPNVNSKSIGKLSPGIYTIVSEAEGSGASKWGKLKSGVGWISLDYAKKIEVVESVEDAVTKLYKLGVINSPEYWKNEAAKINYLDSLLIKSANSIIGAGTRLLSFDKGVEQLVRDGIINSPDYWIILSKENANVGALLCALGGAKKG